MPNHPPVFNCNYDEARRARSYVIDADGTVHAYTRLCRHFLADLEEAMEFVRAVTRRAR